ncbi:MAG: COX15/CtaA family protein [Wenzhouxiangellaceae bacterium]|nr:COX15/CtaA family protein [Wenzhouxiangellaceae bacterium]
MTDSSTFQRIAWATVALTLVVIVAGAWVRLTDAGLGCPDWPGCYGKITWPKASEQIAEANATWGHVREVDGGKAFREMFHRYLAGALGLAILALAVLAWRNRRQPGQPVVLPMTILALVTFQAALGMWTVTLLLKPAIVTAHLIGGMTTLALLIWLALNSGPRRSQATLPARAQHRLVLVALAVVAVQIVLGGWVSTNYAALACTGFPTCNGQWLPPMDFSEGFRVWRGVGVDYEGGVLDAAARNAIHVSHRLWALVVLFVVGWLVVRLWQTEDLRRAGLALAGLLTLQIIVGIYNVIGGLPLANAVAHNGLAALLLATLVALAWRTTHRPGLQ